MSTETPSSPAAELPAALAAAVEAASPWSPYPGLRPFQPDDADYFYGRRLEVDQVMQRLRDSRFVAVIGGSGSGKSSLVLAGAIPRLRTFAIKDAGDFWAPVVATPGTNHVAGDSPIWRLARKFCGQLTDAGDPAAAQARLADCVALLREPGGFGRLVERFGEQLSGADGVDVDQLKVNFLFLLDQFEELFHPSNANDAFIAAECQHLVDRIVEQSKQRHPRVCVALTMRSEHLNDCPRYEELPDAINGSSYLVKRLSLAQLREAIEQPVVRYLRKHVAEQRDARREARRSGRELPEAPPVPERIRIDEALIEQLLADSKAVLADQGHADHLPLLQHLLFWIWHEATLRCAGRLVDVLTLDDLRRAVGPPSPSSGAAAPPTALEQCLENRCEAIYRRIDDPAAWEAAFRSLAFKEPNTGTYTQQRASMAELGLRLGLTGTGVDGLAKRLAPWLAPHGYLHWDIDSRTVKVAHETLIRRWKRFRDWIDAEDRVFHVYLRLLEDCKNWQARDCGTKGLSGGETLRRYEDEKLPQILDDPVRMDRIHRLLGIDRDGQRLVGATGDAQRFPKQSIQIRSDREGVRKQEAEKQREDHEKFAQAQRDYEVERARNTAIEAQAEAARERTATAEAQTEAAKQRLYVANYKTSRFRVVMGLALTALLVVLPLGIWAWTLSAAEKRLATKERTLHRSYALAAESQVGFQPQFENLDGPQGRLRYALIGAQYYEDGSRMADGLSTAWPLNSWQRNLYSQRIDSLRNSERFGEARNTDSLRTILQGGVWALPGAAAASVANAPPAQADAPTCTTRLFVANDVPVATAHFVARPGAADGRGLILEVGENGGSTISVGRLEAGAQCAIETQLLSTPPQQPVRVGIADDAASIVLGFEQYTQFHRVVWNAPTGPRAEPRATVSSPLPGDFKDWNWRLRSTSQPFWTDVALGSGSTVRLFETEPAAIDDAVARRARQLVDVTAPNGSARCRAFAEAHGIDPAGGSEHVWGLPAPAGRGDPARREYCIRVSTVGDGRSTVHTASLYRLSTDAAADAADRDKDLPLVDRLLLGRNPPGGFALDEHDGWFAFQVDGAGWRAVPWSLDAFRRMASTVYQPYKPAPAAAASAASAVLAASKPVCGRPGEDPQFDLPYNLIIGSEMRCPDDAELKSKATPAAAPVAGVNGVSGVSGTGVGGGAAAPAASGSTAKP